MLNLHDSLTRTQKPFPPEGAKDPVTVYACGPTVYHYAHIGNLRTFLTVDLLRRYLEYRGRQVRLVMNVTDVGHMLNDEERGEDKMEAAARREGKTQEELARFYEAAFFKDLEALNFRPAWKNPRATEHLPQMIALVKVLLGKGLAYATEKGDVYYDVAKFGGYGKLSGNTVEALKAGARVEVKEDKRHPADFALWISNPGHQMQWSFEWRGRTFRGYPGWHLECSAMAQEYLGETIDLHVGGEDLKFPHHESEIAQSEGATGKPFARHWLHVTHLLVEGEKMSKSKGNFFTLSDLLENGYSAEAVRFLLLSAHYRTPLNFTLDGLKAAEKALASFRETAGRTDGGERKAGRFETELIEAMDDDLNVSAALAVVHGFMAEANKGAVPAAEGVSFMRAFDDVFGLRLFEEKALEIPDDVKALADERAAARESKDFEESDRLRAEIAERGWIAEDTSGGQKLRKA